MANVRSYIFTFFIFVFLTIGFFHPISAISQDLGRHLLTGEIILNTQNVPKTNFYSFTYPDFPFINHHWLSQVVFFIIFTILNFNGLLLITLGVILFSFYLIFSFAKKESSIFAITLSTILYFPVLFERTDIRPEIFSFLFLSIFITILYKFKNKYTKLIFLLPLIEFLWVNTHIYFAVGIGVIGLFFIDALLPFIPKLIRNFDRKEILILTQHKKIKTLFLILIASILITLINPNGLTGALYPLNVFKNYGYTIEENQTLFFLWNYFGGKQTILYFFITAISLFFLLLLSIRKTRIIDWMLAIVFTSLSIQAERNMALFVFATFIPFTKSLSIVANKIIKKPTPLLKNALFFILILLFFLQIRDVLSKKPIGFGVEIGAKNAADFFIKNNIKGPIFNNFDIGSYLEYRLYPKEKVFIDGRPEAYPVSFIQDEYIQGQINNLKFEEISKKYKLNSIFFAHTDMTPWATDFLKRLVVDPNWKTVYLDDNVIIALKNNDINKKLIEKYEMEDAFKISNLNMQDKLSPIRLAIFFNKVGALKQEKEMYEKILAIDEKNCFALGNLSIHLYQENNPLSNTYSQKYQQFCR